MLTLGLGSTTALAADTATADNTVAAVQEVEGVAPTAVAPTVAVAVQAPGQEVTLKPVAKNAVSASRGMSSSTGWLLAGVAGSLVPLLFFALPLVWLAWIPAAGPIALLGASLWAGVMGLVGGGVVWAVWAMFTSNVGGLLRAVLLSGAVTFGIALVSGLVAALVLVAGLVVSGLLGGYSTPGVRWPGQKGDGSFFNSDGPRPPWQSGRGTQAGGLVWLASAVVAFGIWSGGAIVASLAGPFAAASTLQRSGSEPLEPPLQ
jgi:chromate transport protein ChrA